MNFLQTLERERETKEGFARRIIAKMNLGTIGKTENNSVKFLENSRVAYSYLLYDYCNLKYTIITK